MKRLTLLLCAGLLVGLSACTQPVTTPPTTDPPTTTPPTTTPPTTPVDPTPPTTPPTDPTPPTTPMPAVPFIPAPGAAVGSGNGTPKGTVYVSPSQQEIQVLQLINEFRTTGKINGVSATAGTCVDGQFASISPISYNGVLSFAARKHSEYLSNVGWEGHDELNTASQYFYGATSKSRLQRAYTDLNVTYSAGYGEIVVTGRDDAETAVKSWLGSVGHCKIIMNSSYTNFGAGQSYAPADTSQNKWGHSWTVDFGY